jgi:hypothetical protein
MTTTVLAVAAILISLWAGKVALSQLRHDQDVSGGRGISFDVCQFRSKSEQVIPVEK